MDYVAYRFISAFLAGLVLSQAGSFIQMRTKNILASPSTLGLDGLSIFWVLAAHSIVVFFGGNEAPLLVFLIGIPVFVGLAVGFSHLLRLSQSIEKLILMGLTLNLMVGAVFSLWQFLFLAYNLPFPSELWFGHFRYADQQTLLILLITELFIGGGWFLLRKKFLIYSLGHTVSKNLGLKRGTLDLFMFTALTLSTFAVVSLFGAFSFLGLVFPIVARKLWFKRYDLKGEIVVGAICNGLFLASIDFLCYFFPVFGAEVPVGLIATAVGALSLILLLWKSDNASEILAKKQK